MTNEQIKRIEQILTGYKYDPKMSDGYYCIFKDRFLGKRGVHIAFDLVYKRWMSFCISPNNKEVPCFLTEQETYAICQVINEILGW